MPGDPIAAIALHGSAVRTLSDHGYHRLAGHLDRRLQHRGVIAMSLFSLADRVAVITGSTRGIGRAIAERMAEAGARVVVSSRKPDACQAVVAAIEAAHGPGRAIAIPANISSKEELRNLVDETTHKLGRIDVLVCNAASNPYYGPMAGLEDAAFRKILENNVLSNHWLIQFAAPQMLARRDGSIVIVSSIGGLRGSEVLGAYCISKAADLQLARNLALEYGPHGVRVNCIAPGLIRTDFARALWEDPPARARREAATPLRRIGEPDEIAGAAVFLASRASSFMTGQTMVVDGGVTV
jgi:NAD(P)-dependent dehydrogenase (short-subunit alcohol dehydrogenase family)